MIGLFGLSHGITDWLIMLIGIQGLQDPAFKIGGLGLLMASFYFLIQFGVSTSQLSRRKPVKNAIPVLAFFCLSLL